MKITALVENQSQCGLKTAHGLALFVETKQHKLMFDLGPDETLFDNAEKMKIDLTEVDTVIISHGHRDHGGALGRFMKLNQKAEIYAQRRAFFPHQSKPGTMVKDISLDAALTEDPRIHLLDGDYRIDEELELFTAKRTDLCYSYINGCLYEGEEKDTFQHEQNLLIHEDREVLILGCGHSGILNILDAVKTKDLDVCLGGFHLTNPDTKERVSDELLDEMAGALSSYQDTQFYTCHCTGQEAFDRLCSGLASLHYFACGDVLELPSVK